MYSKARIPRADPTGSWKVFKLAKLFVVGVSITALVACTSEPAKEPPAVVDTAQSAEPAPEQFRVTFETSRGPFVVEAHRAWSPLGVDRFYHLVQTGFYDGTRFFRVIDGFMAQFGINGDPRVSAVWQDRVIRDDTVKHQSNMRGRVSFGTRGPNTRTTQLFINFRDNLNLDAGYPPIGEVVEGMSVVDSLWKGYGEGAPSGAGPDQERIVTEGNQYLILEFPKLDYVRTARVQR